MHYKLVQVYHVHVFYEFVQIQLMKIIFQTLIYQYNKDVHILFTI